MEISPGEKAQDLHRDDFIWQQTHNSDRNKYERGSDVGMGIIVPGTQTRYENGATAVSMGAKPLRACIHLTLSSSSYQSPTFGVIQGVQSLMRFVSQK